MNRSLASFIVSIVTIWWASDRTLHAANFSERFGQAPALAAQHDEITYSDWTGGCSFGERADFSCIIRREAQSANGKRLGFIAFGQGEAARFLFVGVEPSVSKAENEVVIKIDDDLIASGDVVCRESDSLCSSAMIMVDEKLLQRLSMGRALTVQTQQQDIKIEFPLRDFHWARTLLF
jgi:invasion protein IalB